MICAAKYKLQRKTRNPLVYQTPTEPTDLVGLQSPLDLALKSAKIQWVMQSSRSVAFLPKSREICSHLGASDIAKSAMSIWVHPLA